MPLHDWPADYDWMFRDIRSSWLLNVSYALNDGRLPDGYFAMLDIRPFYHVYPQPYTKKRIGIYRETTRFKCARIEIVPHHYKSKGRERRTYIDSVVNCVRSGIHVLAVDILDQQSGSPFDLHSRIAEQLTGKKQADPPPNRPFVVAVYRAGRRPTAELKFIRRGGSLPSPELPISRTRSVKVPLQAGYQTSFDRFPRILKDQYFPESSQAS